MLLVDGATAQTYPSSGPAGPPSPLGEGLGKLLSAVHGLVQGLADGTGTGDLGLEVRLDLVGQDGLGQVAAEDGRIGQDAVQLVGDGLGLAELDAGELGLQLVLQRVSTDLKGVAVVVDGQQVTQPTGDGQRNGDQAVQVAALGDVALDGLAKADADLLGCVGSDALRHVGHEGVGQALLDDLVDEGLRVKDFRVNDDGQALDVAQALDEGDDVLVLHLGADQVIAQHAAVHAHGGVQRVQAGGDLHALGLVDGLAVGHVDTGLLQRGAAVGELVLDDQILRALGVDERGNEGVLGGDDGEPQSITGRPEVGLYFDYFIIQAYNNSSPGSDSKLDKRLITGGVAGAGLVQTYSSVMSEEQITKMTIMTENFEATDAAMDGGYDYTDRYGNKMKSLEGMARWQPSNGFRKGGAGTYHMEAEYGTSPEYKNIRRAIQIMNPSSHSLLKN